MFEGNKHRKEGSSSGGTEENGEALRERRQRVLKLC